MRLMKLPPSVFHVALVAELAGSRRTPEIDERRIRSVAKFDQSGVDAFNLYRAGGAASCRRPGGPFGQAYRRKGGRESICLSPETTRPAGGGSSRGRGT
jgi:hypothetical protein